MTEQTKDEIKAAADLLKNEMEKDGVIVILTQDEAKLVRKVLSCANQMYTVIEDGFRENKVDRLLRKLRKAEENNA